MKRNFDDKVTIIDKDFLNNLSDEYSSLVDYRRNGIGIGPEGRATIERQKNITPPADYQRRLIANTNANPDSSFYKVEYPDMKKTRSPESILREEKSNITYIDKIDEKVPAGIPPVQVNPNIKKPNLDSVKMTDYNRVNNSPPTSHSHGVPQGVPQGMPNRYKNMMQSGCGCVDSLNHIRMCPVCARYQSYEKNLYMVIIIMIIMIAAIIIYFLMKDIRQLKSLIKK